MSAFRQTLHRPGTTKARAVEVLPSSAFADSYVDRPRDKVRMGLRTVSENENATAQRMAARSAWEDHPAKDDLELRVEAFNDYLMTNVLARACVAEQDISKLYFAPAPEDLIRVALTAGGIRHLWHAYQRMVTTESPLSPELDDEGIGALSAALGCLGQLDVSTQARVRRLAYAISEDMKAATNG